MPIESISPSRRHGAGLIQAALAAPVGPVDAPRSVGPFAVVVHALPIEVAPGTLDPDFDVRPHPHIGLAAVTYMLQGHVTHRDSLGSRREVGPGGINWTIAGQGIVHSERFERLRLLGGRMELMQLLIALPDGGEDIEPRFVHVEPENVPTTTDGGATIRQVAGEGAPPGLPPMFFDDVSLEARGLARAHRCCEGRVARRHRGLALRRHRGVHAGAAGSRPTVATSQQARLSALRSRT